MARPAKNLVPLLARVVKVCGPAGYRMYNSEQIEKHRSGTSN